MPATVIPPERIPELAAQVDSPVLCGLLARLRETGFIQDSPELDPETVYGLQRLTALGLVDPGYDRPTGGKPFIWISNDNGERVLKHLETSPHGGATVGSKLQIHPRAHTALASLPEKDRMAVLAAVESLRRTDPGSWPHEKVVRLGPDKPVYLLQASPELRAFIRVLDSDVIELSDIVREDTLRLFLERYRAGSKVG
jgi:hypothetical protein